MEDGGGGEKGEKGCSNQSVSKAVAMSLSPRWDRGAEGIRAAARLIAWASSSRGFPWVAATTDAVDSVIEWYA